MKIQSATIKLITTVAVVCTTVTVIFGPFNLVLSFNGVNSDEFHFWQLITAHFVHYDIAHLVTNMLALGLLLYLFPSTNKNIIAGFILAIVFIDLYLWFSGVRYYVGFSGLLYVIFGIALARMLQMKQYIRLASLVAGLYLYMFHLSEPFHDSQNIIWYSDKHAHLIGIFAGFVVTVLGSDGNNEKVKVLNRQFRRIN